MDDRHDFRQTEIADLVGSRLCHDLVNPLSAISNGLELMALSGLPQTPELGLIDAALGDAMARIRFFRVAFGAARDGEVMSERELREILGAVYGNGRLSIDWQVTGDLTRRDARRALLMLNCAETALPLGGTLCVTRDGDCWTIEGTGRKLNPAPEIWGLLDGLIPPGALPAARVQFSLLARDCAADGRRLEHAFNEAACEVRLTCLPH